MKTLKQIFLGLWIISFIVSCKNSVTKNNYKSKQTSPSDTNYHGYNELANPDNRKNFTISDYNTDNPGIKNIDRPKNSTIKTHLDTTLLFHIWTKDPKGPNADFVFSGKSFYVVDYDGNGDMPYELIDRKLKIYYNDFIQEGEIISVDKTKLRIKWEGFNFINTYERWKN